MLEHGSLVDEGNLPATLLVFPSDQATALAGQLVDSALRRNSISELERLLDLFTEFQATSLPAHLAAAMHHATGNVWAGLRLIRHVGDSQWKWRQPEMEQELLARRLTINSTGFSVFDSKSQARVLTNVGNLLDTIGRSIEAISYFDEALRIWPTFGMAMVNKALALKTIAELHHDKTERAVLLRVAWQNFTLAPREDFETGQIESQVEQEILAIEGTLTKEFLRSQSLLEQRSLGDSVEEEDYRRWGLKERLFLNPLLVLGEESWIARDTLMLPGVVVPITEGPGLLGLFTQIKQEYVTARFLAWEGAIGKKAHFSDRHTHLADTLDYGSYGLHLEKTKIAHRMAYSILDKCAFLLNKYLELGIPDSTVNLNKLWFVKGKPEKGLNPKLIDTPNLALRGLFWLARDLHDKEDFADAIAPDARELKEIRDHLEHKYLKVHSEGVPSPIGSSSLRDQYARSISRSALEAKTLVLLRLARSAICYLCFGIAAEELDRRLRRSYQGVIPQIPLPPIPDEWKS